ncbi:ubiquitin carboxyl-terminal hydrolase 25 isoform X1 [Ricinus communis]|uniref:ubiquitin carboxyl-terminal hydrolase 25 isoform X1 n=1 Tax=Ricinus communis TaxID=3988 RepID=UPI00201A60E9|nr:ubiquitin carboxyl-terminal hydrolase 25 isoform X1 [Ricinus communis]
MGFELQMSWQPSLLSQKRKNRPPLGLRNLGNSCYLNSVLQCLTYTPPLANFCLRLQHSSLCDSVSNGERKRDCPFCILEKRIVRSLSLDLTLDAPAKIQSCLKIFAEHFKGGQQEDAHEFLRYVIDACHNTCLRLMKLRRKGINSNNKNYDNDTTTSTSTSTSVVKEIFGGTLQSQVKCLSCHSESNKVDEIMDISLDVLHSNSLREAMQKFFQPEILDGNNKYRCERDLCLFSCKKLVAARKQMSILQAPNILVIQLKRFEGIFGGKIDKAIAFEEVLVLSSFMCKGSQDPRPEYNLFGTIVHSGYSPESGHYYAYIKDATGRWYCCNDSYVTLSTMQDVLSEKVYILFFSRSNQRPGSAGPSVTPIKPCNPNGCEASNIPKVTVSPNAVDAEASVEQPSRKDIPSMSKVDKVPSSPRVKFNIFGNSVSKRILPTGDGKAESHKSQNMEMNGSMKDRVYVEKHDKDMPSTINGNGCNKSRKINDGETGQAITKASANGVTQNGASDSGKPCLYESNGSASTDKGPGQHKLQNGGVNCHSGIPELKRKLKEDSCILIAQDAQSRTEVKELKEALKQEASTVLRSCGWSSKVYSFMCSRKRLCAREPGNLPSDIDLKKLLIAEAKSTFISQIPESLKEDLVKRLQSFSQEK